MTALELAAQFVKELELLTATPQVAQQLQCFAGLANGEWRVVRSQEMAWVVPVLTEFV